MSTTAKKIDLHLKELAKKLDIISGQYIPVALSVLAAVLATILFLKAQKVKPLTQAVSAKKPSYTLEDVKEHNTAEDVWIILNGKVYDVTPYVEEHPGGKAILRNAGSDSTKGFYGPQHPDRVFDLIEDFYIGDIRR